VNLVAILSFFFCYSTTVHVFPKESSTTPKVLSAKENGESGMCGYKKRKGGSFGATVQQKKVVAARNPQSVIMYESRSDFLDCQNSNPS
jgi:hypothetical protein